MIGTSGSLSFHLATLPVLLGALSGPVGLRAQGTTTATIAGVLEWGGAAPVDAAEIGVLNRATGVRVRVWAHLGRFIVPALEPGGPYAVEVRAIGFEPEVRDSLYLALGQRLTLSIPLRQVAVRLADIAVATAGPISLGREGPGGRVVPESLLTLLPTVNRDIYDFVPLNPHVPALGQEISGAGVNPRYSSFQVDGVTEQAVHGRNPAGITGGGKPITLEAVREYQVVLAPYDVALGNFAGTLVNAVTRSGTNQLRGAVFVYARSEQLARADPGLRVAAYEQVQYGVTAGGPLVRDRAHFFVAAELQRLSAPAGGPSLGSSAVPPPADSNTIAAFIRLLRGTYRLDPGSAGPVADRNPLLNLFVRGDLAIPSWNSRLVVRHNHAQGEQDVFQRSDEPFALSSTLYAQVGRTEVTAAQLHTVFPGGAANEVIVGYYTGPFKAAPATRSPLVSVLVPGTRAGTIVTLQAGTPPEAESFRVQQYSLELSDVVRLSTGRLHRMTIGGRVELFGTSRNDVAGTYGDWEFASLDSLSRGEALRYRVARDDGGGHPSLTGQELSVFAGDAWDPSDRLTLTLGVRADWPSVNGRPARSPAIEAGFGRRTDVLPASPALWGPRAGVDWRPAPGQRLQGGLGVFTGRAPLAWWLNAFAEYGEGLRTLTCEEPHAAPSFEPDFRTPPQQCADQATFDTTLGGPVTLLNRSLRFPQVFRASLAYERSIPAGFLLRIESLYSSNLHDAAFLTRALGPPMGADPHGRVIYGEIDPTGIAAPRFLSQRFRDVVEVKDVRRNYSVDLSVQLEHRLSRGFAASLAYTWSKTRDVQSPSDIFSSFNWSHSPVSGNIDRLQLGISNLDQPHRVVAALTWAGAGTRWHTGLSLYYIGHSGQPFTFVTGGSDGRRTGDLNADGSTNDDPVYLPHDALAEVLFDARSTPVDQQAAALDALIGSTPCLQKQRGRIMARNSCRTPWEHTLNLAVREQLPTFSGHRLELQVQLFNALNLLSGSWGLVRTPRRVLLAQTGQQGGAGGEPVVRFDPDFRPWDPDPARSAYQFQVAARYTY